MAADLFAAKSLDRGRDRLTFCHENSHLPIPRAAFTRPDLPVGFGNPPALSPPAHDGPPQNATRAYRLDEALLWALSYPNMGLSVAIPESVYATLTRPCLSRSKGVGCQHARFALSFVVRSRCEYHMGSQGHQW